MSRCTGAGREAEVVGAYRERLMGFRPTLASEKLAEWGQQVDYEPLRRWLIAEGIWQRPWKRGPHRRAREPKRRFGKLVQLDGSHHDWFGSGERCCLMNMVDGATGRRLAHMEAERTTAGAMALLWRWIVRYGVPMALYVDGKTVYVGDREATAEEQLAGEGPLTEFGKACRTLGIWIIQAHSAARKGRVERKHGVYQDRFVKELALRGIATIEEAIALLAGRFIEGLNALFFRGATGAGGRSPAVSEDLELVGVFVFEETPTVANDWTMRYERRWYQITGSKHALPRPEATVTVQRRLDGSLHLLCGWQALEFREIPATARIKPKAPAPQAMATIATGSAPRRPAPDHPWRRPFSRRLLVQRQPKPIARATAP